MSATDSSASATVTAPARKPAASKPAKPAALSPLVAALTRALAAANKAKPTKVFNEEGFRADMAKHGLPAAFIDAAARESRKKFEKEHGNNGEQQTRALVSILAPAMGGLDELSRIVRDMASEARNAGKVAFTGSEYVAALKGEKDAKPEVQSVIDKASDLRKAGKPWSEIETTLNLSPSSRQALYVAAADYPDVFPVKASA